eukprot:TRINITY_DN48226_c0_g1_i1.p1 TRINITY_DN48226_c0_g1~~TRINITY_DN48226_c0_g1_i1.p1  ORF type:complete len:409 (+),score=54.87 TRINITY_DN48226_c0_g1_i1:99-1325(+)
MEVTVVEAQGPPSRPVLAMHTGSVRRQAKMEVNQPFILPHPGEMGCSVDVALFQELASHTLRNACQAEVVCKIPVRKPDGGTSQVKLLVRPSVAASLPRRVDDTSGKDYIDQHNMQSHIQSLIQDVLRDQPGDPYKYMLEQLKQSQAIKATGGAHKVMSAAVEVPAAKNACKTPSEQLMSPSQATPPETDKAEVSEPLVPRAPAAPRRPDQPRPVHTGRVVRLSGGSGSGNGVLQTLSQPVTQACEGKPKAGEIQASPEIASVRGSSEARACAKVVVGHVLRMPSCVNVAVESIKEDERITFARKVYRLVLPIARQNCMVPEATIRQQGQTLSQRLYNRSSVLLSPEYNRSLGISVLQFVYKQAAAIISAKEEWAEEDFLKGEERRVPTPIVHLTSSNSWSQWLGSPK